MLNKAIFGMALAIGLAASAGAARADLAAALTTLQQVRPEGRDEPAVPMRIRRTPDEGSNLPVT